MNFIFELAHPKHFHQFRYLIDLLQNNGHSVTIIAREKEVLWNLLDENDFPYIRFSHSKSAGLLTKLFSHLISVRKLLIIVNEHKTDVFISKASLSTVFIKIFKRKCKTIIFPDSEGVWLTNKILWRFADFTITPETNWRNFGRNHIKVPGIFENSYLFKEYIRKEKFNFPQNSYDTKTKTVFIRFVGWKANHDINSFGFSGKQKKALVDLFLKYFFQIIISSEGKLPDDLNEYANPFPASKIHKVLKACDYYVGDSQTMAAEAALLGLKSFRYNSFVGTIPLSNFIFLENKRLLRNFADFDELVKNIEDEITGKSNFFNHVSTYWEECGDQNEIIFSQLMEIVRK